MEVLNLSLVILNDINSNLIVILGPTASGKTQLAAHLAKALNGEIISADSRQVYKGMDIGTGKDLFEYTIDNQTIEVHLINNRKAGEKYNLAEFQQDFQKSYDEILEKSKIPILCGGSGLYIQSVLKDYWQTQIPNNEALRESLSLLGKDEIIENYSHLWQIEKAFRISKTDLRIRPIYHRIKRRIEAHICIAFAAYKVYKELERQLKEKQSSLSPEQAIEIAKTIYTIKIEHPVTKDTTSKIIYLTQDQKYLAKLFDF